MGDRMKVAGCQIDVALRAPAENIRKIATFAARARASGARLAVFPECSVSGYCFDDRKSALEFAQAIPGEATAQVAAIAKDLDMHIIFGLLEKDGANLFNTCVLVGPTGIVGKHRKLHLPFLGVDRFTDRGDAGFKIFEVDGVRLGMIVCYDGSFCESSRALALLGADLIVLPTNWPPGSEGPATFMSQTRAWENHVYFMPVNRVGTEGGFKFIGQSKICDPFGKVIAGLNDSEENIFYAEVQPELAREKHIVRIPGKLECDYIHDRRPELYGELTRVREKPST